MVKIHPKYFDDLTDSIFACGDGFCNMYDIYRNDSLKRKMLLDGLANMNTSFKDLIEIRKTLKVTDATLLKLHKCIRESRKFIPYDEEHEDELQDVIVLIDKASRICGDIIRQVTKNQ